MAEFSKLRELFWPIHRHELKKLLPMVIMMFFFLFNYTIMRDTKDTLILGVADSEVLPFLKFWGTLPTAILFVIIYSKLSNMLKEETLFYVIILPFLVFFPLFGYVIYPFRELFQPTGLADSMVQFVTTNFSANMQYTSLKLISVFRNWPYAVFYILSELWGSMGVSLLFWQFANNITSSKESKRFYPRFTQLGNLALVISGGAVVYFSNIRKFIPTGVDPWGVSLQWLMGAVGIGCLAIIATYWWMNRKVLTDKTLVPEKIAKHGKPKMSIKESFMYLIRSKYLGAIALLVIGYGISINLIETVYKGQVKALFGNENDINTFFGYISMACGIVTFFVVTFSGYIIRNIGWYAGALFTPLVLLITGAIFFGSLYYRESLSIWLAFSPIIIAVTIGAIQNVCAKSFKYSFFDPTKEMAYIPLDQESKVKGKAAIDVVGARLGKSGGALLLMPITLFFGALMSNLHILMVIIGFVIAAWLFGIHFLHKHEPALQTGTPEKKESKEADSNAVSNSA